jgi:DNA-binding NarL/FixJ family response regulator
LNEEGYHVIRFGNREVFNQLEEVLPAILEACGAPLHTPAPFSPTRRTVADDREDSSGGKSMPDNKTLSSKSVAVLKLIADGHSYDQILAAYPALTYLDIFGAAQEALIIAGEAGTTRQQRLRRIRAKHPRAYEKWSEEEDQQLRQLVQAGMKEKDIAAQLQRQLGAIRSRMEKLGLIEDVQDGEGEEVH